MNITPILYNSYLFPNGALLQGRLLHGPAIPTGEATNSWWTNTKRTLKLFQSKGVTKQKGKASLAGETFKFQTDHEGYFEIHLEQRQIARLNIPSTHWEPIEYSFEDVNEVFQGKALVANSSTRLGLISDLDDTVLRTNVYQKKRTIFQAIIGNAHRKKVIPGARAFLQSFSINQYPLVYVTRSPYELYPRVSKVFDLNDCPSGPLLMRRYNKDGKFGEKNPLTGQKYRMIKQVLQDAPNFPWVLVGDSSEQDTSIYLKLANEFPKQIAAIFIRIADRYSPDAAFEQRKKFHAPCLFRFFGSYEELPSPATILSLHLA